MTFGDFQVSLHIEHVLDLGSDFSDRAESAEMHLGWHLRTDNRTCTQSNGYTVRLSCWNGSPAERKDVVSDRGLSGSR